MNKLLTVGLLVIFLVALGVGVYFNSQLPNDDLDVIEIREYEGKDLSSINTFRENSIKGPQYIDETNYSLSILGFVKWIHCEGTNSEKCVKIVKAKLR